MQHVSLQIFYHRGNLGFIVTEETGAGEVPQSNQTHLNLPVPNVRRDQADLDKFTIKRQPCCRLLVLNHESSKWSSESTFSGLSSSLPDSCLNTQMQNGKQSGELNIVYACH
jgi:hypothetical protein